jgi:hypothetical protein
VFVKDVKIIYRQFKTDSVAFFSVMQQEKYGTIGI